MTMDAIVDLDLLVAHVTTQAPLAASELHGERHWLAVARAGAEIVERTPGADRQVVFLFALLHDACRRTESREPEHGPRAAALAGELPADLLRLDEPRLGLLQEACRLHEAGTTSADPTIGACFDADRLNLWRVWIEPDPALLSTAAAREPGLIRRARGFHDEEHDWRALAARFEAAAG